MKNIQTKRLLMVPLGTQYLMSTHEYASNLDNTIYMVHLPNTDISETKKFLELLEKEWKKANPEYYEFAILFQSVHIGAVSLYINRENITGELGWIINKKYWGNGLAEEAARGLIQFAIEELKLQKFIAHCDSENIGSYRLMEKLGMSFAEKTRGRKNKSSDEEREELLYELEIE